MPKELKGGWKTIQNCQLIILYLEKKRLRFKYRSSDKTEIAMQTQDLGPTDCLYPQLTIKVQSR